jgi:DNA/RNA-binding domain of Phe-tRNA-synthetase-like protein
MILGTGAKEKSMKEVTISDKCLEIYPWMKFGYCFVKNLSHGESSDYLRHKQKETEDYVREHSQSLLERAKCLSRFYKMQGEKNRSHIESLIKSISNGKSIKPVNSVVDSVMIPELRNALLLGVHDLDRIQGDIVLDVAGEGDMFVGLGNQSIITRSHEVVLRDHSGIWASYTQGPDMATVVHPGTKHAMILGFFAPETSPETMTLGIREAVDNLSKAAEGEAEEVRVIP